MIIHEFRRIPGGDISACGRIDGQRFAAQIQTVADGVDGFVYDHVPYALSREQKAAMAGLLCEPKTVAVYNRNGWS